MASDEKVRHEEAAGTHRLVMNDGPNALNLALMDALSDELAELAERGGPPVILASSHEVLFCPGWDLKQIAGAQREEVAAFLRRFNRLVLDLFSYPGPTAAAISGHAVAGGCLLAMACDLRVMGTGRPRIGLAELNLGVPVPAASLLMLTARLAPNVVEDLVVGGDGCTAERAREQGVVNRVAASPQVVSSTESELARVAAKPLAAFRASKRFLFGDIVRRMSETAPEDDELFLDCWFSPETQARIAATVDRLGG